MTGRNGKPRSCEPCRKTRARCDHTLPTCAGWEARGTVNECYWHSAPLTRPRPPSRVLDQPSQRRMYHDTPLPPCSSSRHKLQTIYRRSKNISGTSSPLVSVSDIFLDSGRLRFQRCGFQGYMVPTGFAATLPDDHEYYAESDKTLSETQTKPSNRAKISQQNLAPW